MSLKEKFFRGIVKHKKPVIIVFFLAVIIFGLSRQFIRVNYDMNDYLPETSPSTVSLDKLRAEFGSGIPNARVMVQDITIPEAIKLKKQLLQIEGVSEVTWLDDTADITVPFETLDSDIAETYYKDNSALYSVTIDEEKRIQAVNAIRRLIGENNAMTGTAVNTAAATETTTKEIKRIIAIAVPAVLLVLFLTTTSWFEPVIFLGSIGIAIILNAGSNLLFGEISFVTNAAGNILQLAVSLDYSVFLLHRFREIREEGAEPKEAMIQALCKSTGSILSSGITTVIGFLALVIMKFKIGPDMGYALAKGISFSLVTVFILTPVLTLYCYKLIDRTMHRSFIPRLDGFAAFVGKITIPLSLLFIIIIVPSYLGSINNTYYYGSSHIFNESTQLGKDSKKIEAVFGKANTYVLMVPKGDLAAEKELSADLKELPQVGSIISYVDKAGAEIPVEYVDSDILSKLIGDHYSRMIITVKTDYEGAEAFQTVESLRAAANRYYPDSYYLAGETASTYDLMNTVTSDNILVNMIAAGAVFLILIIFMKSISLPIILVLAIETAVWFNFSLSYYAGTPLFYIGYLIISSVQLGATVDYAILLTDRYKEFREEYHRMAAVKKTIEMVTVSILTSGTVMTFMGFFLGKMTSHGVLAQLGLLLGKGTLCSLVIVLFILPGLLYLLDPLIQKTTRGVSFINKTKAYTGGIVYEQEK